MRTLSTPGTVRRLLQEAVRGLEGAGLMTARQEAEWLLAHLLGVGRWALHLEPERAVPPEVSARFDELLARRRRGEPLQHLLGREEFCGLRLRVTPEVLIPRPETELLVEWALEVLASAPRGVVIDLGTGSGAIACAMAHSCPGIRVLGVDISPGALAVARENVRALGLEGRVRLVQGDLFGPLASPRRTRRGRAADLVVANPPYIASGDLSTLPVEVRAHEPRLALDGGPDGMAVHRGILAAAPEYLRPGGWLLLEVGEGQAGALAEMLAGQGAFEAVQLRKDLRGVDRLIGARRR